MAQDGSKMAQNDQDGTTWPQDGPAMVRDSPKIAFGFKPLSSEMIHAFGSGILKRVHHIVRQALSLVLRFNAA